MSEIECKIPLTIQQFQDMKISMKESIVQHMVKEDAYYSKYLTTEERKEHQEPLVRIRKEVIDGNEMKILTLKKKSIQNGIEVNIEKESEFDEDSGILFLLETEGYKEYFSKKKQSYFWYWDTIVRDFIYQVNCELVVINDTHYYFEVESVDLLDEHQEDRIQALKQCCEHYGLDFNKKDSRSWKEIIES